MNWKKTMGSILFFVLAVLTEVFTIVYGWTDTQRLVSQLVVAIFLAVSLLLLFGDEGIEKLKLMKEKWKTFFFKLLFFVFQKRNDREIYGNALIQGYTETSQRVDKNKASGKIFRKRYKDMDAAERIRYFYAKFIRKQIRKGYAFRRTETPDEIKGNLYREKRISNISAKLFDEYEKARYNNHANFTETDVEQVKKIYKTPQV